MVDVDAFESARRDHEKDGRRILAIGNADPGKGIVNLILAMRVVHEQHPDVSLHIIGAMPEGLEILIADLPVTLLGRLPRADVVNHMRKADVLAVPSRVETFGIASAEGLAAGLRVVATDVAPLADLIVKHGGIIVPANDARALGAGLIEAVEQRRPRDEGAGDELRRRYGREAIASQLDTIYRQVLGQPAAVPYSGHVEEVRTTHE
jgi:glycosyltransferase involved in cell wall biosynthesis